MRELLCAAVLLIVFAPVSYAANDQRNGAIFYGDQCQLCGEYGYCSKTPTQSEAVSALSSHFGKRGFRVIVIRRKERFLEAEIYKDGNVRDRVILDLRTGRIRSVY